MLLDLCRVEFKPFCRSVTLQKCVSLFTPIPGENNNHEIFKERMI